MHEEIELNYSDISYNANVCTYNISTNFPQKTFNPEKSIGNEKIKLTKYIFYLEFLETK